MKRQILFVAFFLSIAFFLAPNVQAEIISSEEQVVIKEGEIIDDDLFVVGEGVTVEGIINGDLYAAGRNIKISGTVNGDVIAAGGMIEITGEVKDDVRVAGGNITIQGASIGDSLMVFGGNVNVEKGSIIGGGFLFGAGSVNMNASVARGIMGGGGSVNVNGSIGKDIYVGTEKLTLGPGTMVAGDLVYGSEKEVELLETATVSGETRHILPPQKGISTDMANPEVIKTTGKNFNLVMRVWSYLAALVVGLLAIYFFRKLGQQIIINLEKNWLANLGAGFLLIILALPAFVMLMVTGIAIPLAIILGMVLLINLYLSKIVIGVVLGRKLATFFPKQKISAYLSFTLGLAIYYLLSALPILGGFVKIIALLLGLGALFSYQRGLLLKNRE